METMLKKPTLDMIAEDMMRLNAALETALAAYDRLRSALATRGVVVVNRRAPEADA